MASVEFKNIVKKFKDNTVLNGVNFSVSNNEFIVIVGPSGCGKSTLLRMLAGLEEITAGDILIDGVRVNEYPPSKRGIAMVFQDYALYPHMTVEENMSFALRLRKTPKEEVDARVKEAADILQISHLLKRTPKQLSGGQRQRVAIGRAIVRSPKAFLFDEPLSNLDAKLREEMRVEINKLHHKLNATIIYVTHDQIEAMTLASRIVIMNKGIVQQLGTPMEVYNKPANLFVAGFIGSPTMNFLRGTVETEGEKVLFKNDSITIDLPASLLTKEKAAEHKEIVIGVRPDDIVLDKAGLTLSPEYKGILEVSELLGNRTNLYFHIGENRLLSTIDTARKIAPGTELSFRFNFKNMHVFDARTENRISD